MFCIIDIFNKSIIGTYNTLETATEKINTLKNNGIYRIIVDL